MSRSPNNLRVVGTDDDTVNPSATSDELDNHLETSETFDSELDLGPIRPDDDLADEPQSTNATEKDRSSGIGGLIRKVLYTLGFLMIAMVALVMYLRGNKAPPIDPPATASVAVIENALTGRVERPEVNAGFQENQQEVAKAPVAPQEPSVQPHVTVPVAQAESVNDVVEGGASSEASTSLDSVLSVIRKVQQVLGEHRESIQSQLEQNRLFQAEFHEIRASSEATNKRVDELAAEINQVQLSFETNAAKEAQKVATLRRQLAMKTEEAQQQTRIEEEKRREPPPFRVSSVTLWGSDYLATVTLSSGKQRDITVEELLDGWKIEAISATAVTVRRLRDGVRLNLAAGV